MSELNKFCRLCLTEDKLVTKLFGEPIGDAALPFYEKVMLCVPVQIKFGDGLPALLCQNCSDRVDSIWRFKALSEQVDTALRRLLDDHKYISTKINWEEKIRSIVEEINPISSQLKKNKAKSEKPKLSSSEFKFENELIDEGLVTVEPDLQNGFDDDWPESVHSPASSSSPQSPMSSKEYEGLSQPKKKIRGGRQTEYSCEFCGRKFTRSNHLAQHELTHTAEKPFGCSDCGKSFWYKASLIGHIKQTHTGDVNYTCELCGKGFFKKTELTRHKPTHSNETPHKCPQCGMGFKITKTLKRHIRNVHTAQRSHVCHTCGKTFIQLQTLKVHMVLHSGEKPYVCSYCGKGFAQSAPLKTHTRIHTGEKPFACHVCGDTFSTRTALTCHAFKHKDVLPYLCTRCPCSFRLKKDLVCHEQGHDDLEFRLKKYPNVKLEESASAEQPSNEQQRPEMPQSMHQLIPGALPSGDDARLYNASQKTAVPTENQPVPADCSIGNPNPPISQQQRLTSMDSMPSSTLAQFGENYSNLIETGEMVGSIPLHIQRQPLSHMRSLSIGSNNQLQLKMEYQNRL